MSDPFIGEIRMWGPNFAPRNWAFCNGQLLQIAQNPALFSILGTTYGGDGRTTFGLPDLQGRGACHAGAGPGLSQRRLGQRFGQEAVALNVAQLPAHTHAVTVSDGAATAVDPTGRFLAERESPGFAANAGAPVGALSQVGGGEAHPNMPPYLALYFIICLQGIFPPRN